MTSWTDNLINDDNRLSDILKKAKTIAVIGLSDRPEVTSYGVSAVIQSRGYKIIPINPKAQEILGEKVYTSVDLIPDSEGPVDIVNIFRRPEFITEHAREILKMKKKPRCVWMQLGIENPAAAQMLAETGIWVVQDRCIKVDAARLL